MNVMRSQDEDLLERACKFQLTLAYSLSLIFSEICNLYQVMDALT